MITIIHGDDVASSRNYLQDQKRKSVNQVSFDGQFALEEFIQVAQGRDLFVSEKKIFVENFFSKNKLSSSFTKNLLDYINKNSNLLEVFLWEGKEIQKKLLNLFDNPLIKTFMFPKTIFLFLDSLRPGNYKNSIDIFHKALQSTEAELIFFMLQRQFRLLIALRSKVPLRRTPESSQIDEIMRLVPWQRSKFERQATLFSTDKLLDLYNLLYSIEVKHKTGSLSYPLTHAIDFFLLSI